MSMMVSTKVCEATPMQPITASIISSDQTKEKVAHDLSSALRRKFSNVDSVVTTFEKVEPITNIYVILDNSQAPLLTTLTDSRLRKLQEIFGSAKGVLWVACGGSINCAIPGFGTIPGFLRTLRSESGGLPYVALDLEGTESALSGSQIQKVLDVFHKVLIKSTGSSEPLELEFAESNRRLMIPRIVVDGAADQSIGPMRNEIITELQPLWQEGNPVKLEMGHRGRLDSLRFSSNHSIDTPLQDDEVEIEVRAVGLDTADLAAAIGQVIPENGFGKECSGVVTRVGSSVEKFRPGQRVAGVTVGCMGTHARLSKSLVNEIPETLDFSVAASVQTTYVTAYYALYHAARLQAAESILIHSSADALGEACIQLSKLIGAQIMVTVETPSKASSSENLWGLPDSHVLGCYDLAFESKIMALTNGKGVDIIININGGDATLQHLRCIAMFGRFIDVKRDCNVDSNLVGMDAFARKGATYVPVAFDMLYERQPRLLGNLSRKVVDLFRDGRLVPIAPLTTFKMSKAEEAFKHMQGGKHAGKTVLTADRDCQVQVSDSQGSRRIRAYKFLQVLPKPKARLKLSSVSSYLLVGGLGGIGKAFAKWMVEELEAKNLVLLSRSGLDAAGARDTVALLQQAGAVVEVLKCDVSNAQDLTNTLDECASSLPPIRGVIQAAMVLQVSTTVALQAHLITTSF